MALKMGFDGWFWNNEPNGAQLNGTVMDYEVSVEIMRQLQEKIKNSNNEKVKQLVTLLKDVFIELDEQKEIIFNKFKQETKDNYIEQEFDKKKQEFDKLEISIVYFNKEYDVLKDETGHGWSYYKKNYNKNLEQFNQGNWPEWLELSINDFSIARTGERWKTDNFFEISKNMLIVLGDIKISHDKDQPKNAWVEGIKVNTKFE
ncbi:hypothetical protein [Spiroplasma taiwanense]|uniref:Uncharacterized protein n=1 Tax=Spiroplasma taiwanense CT-1 TaxID=1276220 RepID=S5MC45_9MOLU|nr:hypothetical protein [Spiroplasma taiwanense]AGR41298.1 hypothetical protein STAIW_v1c06800 [Spiroplasma taiwanense CT-1]